MKIHTLKLHEIPVGGSTGYFSVLRSVPGPQAQDGWEFTAGATYVVATKDQRVLLIPWNSIRVAEGEAEDAPVEQVAEVAVEAAPEQPPAEAPPPLPLELTASKGKGTLPRARRASSMPEDAGAESA